jgi:hypothetical protein
VIKDDQRGAEIIVDGKTLFLESPGTGAPDDKPDEK